MAALSGVHVRSTQTKACALSFASLPSSGRTTTGISTPEGVRLPHAVAAMEILSSLPQFGQAIFQTSATRDTGSGFQLRMPSGTSASMLFAMPFLQTSPVVQFLYVRPMCHCFVFGMDCTDMASSCLFADYDSMPRIACPMQVFDLIALSKKEGTTTERAAVLPGISKEFRLPPGSRFAGHYRSSELRNLPAVWPETRYAPCRSLSSQLAPST